MRQHTTFLVGTPPNGMDGSVLAVAGWAGGLKIDVTSRSAPGSWPEPVHEDGNQQTGVTPIRKDGFLIGRSIAGFSCACAVRVQSLLELSCVNKQVLGK
ncbi:MAG TPA: hypothetical protein VJ698_22115 [Noviherbaspirillum sp.]|uniref:hypothetical protein n=1 Tax=Noviherbaspirillum sp. TaxID=1926288 RepID=UPI002B4A4612|nr:hypothetical protein [Noviherbaspirillum sp.]HJV88181.1 hypothetical protein [Noviherbaspirillum sp.]